MLLGSTARFSGEYGKGKEWRGDLYILKEEFWNVDERKVLLICINVLVRKPQFFCVVMG